MIDPAASAVLDYVGTMSEPRTTPAFSEIFLSLFVQLDTYQLPRSAFRESRGRLANHRHVVRLRARAHYILFDFYPDPR